MTGRGQAVTRLSALWLATAVLLAATIAWRIELSFDLSAFFPREATLSHNILVEQIQRGPASRLFVIGIGGGAAHDRAEASDGLKAALGRSPLFASVMNGEIDADSSELPAIVRDHYPLLRDLDYSAVSIDAAVKARLRDLAFGGGQALRDIVATDPMLATIDILEALSPVDVDGDLWVAADGRTVVMAEARASSIDTDAQRAALAAIRTAFASLPEAADLAIDVTGFGAFGIELEQAIRAEATLYSIVASLALMLVLLLVFRSPRLVLIAALPLGLGFLAGLALVSVLFDTVHGITLAFGFTMLGIAIDYPLHLASHARAASGAKAIRKVWPTMRIGVASTAAAYLALAFAGSDGLAQLGVFTAAGVIVAALATRTWLPLLVATAPPAEPDAITAPRSPRLGFLAAGAVLVLACGAIVWSPGDGLWDDNLSSLSPVPAGRLASDRVLRSAAATPDMRYQLVLHRPSLQALLVDCERAEQLLASARDSRLIGGWQSICQLLPSQEQQVRRQAAIPNEDVVRERLRQAVAGTPFRVDAFAPFASTLASARRATPLQPPDFAGTPLGAWVDAHLVELESHWVALISLVNPRPGELATLVADWPLAAELIDLQSASVELVRDYRKGALRAIGVGALLILLMLWFDRRRFVTMLWIGTSVTAAIVATLAVTNLVHGSLTVMHLVALLLVLGLGLDYALFLSRVETKADSRFTHKSVFACAASTTIAFGVLALSSIPVLKYLGLTVATGSAVSYLIAYAGSRRAVDGPSEAQQSAVP